MRWRYVERNVADQASPPKQEHPEMRAWTAEQVRRFLAHARGDRLYAAWLLAATTGMRRGEILGLRWEDLDLANGRLSVQRALVTVGREIRFSEPKTDRGRRSVALDVATGAALREHRRRQAEERLAWGPAYRDAGLVFCQEDGSPIHPDRATKGFRRLARSADLPAIRLHDLRHTYASLALAAGVHPKVVSDRLGHSSVKLTLDTYSHAIPALQEEAAERVAGLILGT